MEELFLKVDNVVRCVLQLLVELVLSSIDLVLVLHRHGQLAFDVVLDLVHVLASEQLAQRCLVLLLQVFVGDVKFVVCKLQLLTAMLVSGVDLLDVKLEVVALGLHGGHQVVHFLAVLRVLVGKFGLMGCSLVCGLNFKRVNCTNKFVRLCRMFAL